MYVDAIAARFAGEIRTRRPSARSERPVAGDDRPSITRNGRETFDRVVLATHSDQALAMLARPTDAAASEVLGAIRYQPNRATLHTDVVRAVAAAARLGGVELRPRSATSDAATLTYDMTASSTCPARERYLVSLNSDDAHRPGDG